MQPLPLWHKKHAGIVQQQGSHGDLWRSGPNWACNTSCSSRQLNTAKGANSSSNRVCTEADEQVAQTGHATQVALTRRADRCTACRCAVMHLPCLKLSICTPAQHLQPADAKGPDSSSSSSAAREASRHAALQSKGYAACIEGRQRSGCEPRASVGVNNIA